MSGSPKVNILFIEMIFKDLTEKKNKIRGFCFLTIWNYMKKEEVIFLIRKSSVCLQEFILIAGTRPILKNESWTLDN